MYVAGKGRSHFLLRNPDDDKNKKIQNRLQKREDELVEAVDEISTLKDEVLKLSSQLKEMNEESKEHDKYAYLLNELFHKSIIDNNGDFIDQSKNIRLICNKFTKGELFLNFLFILNYH